MFSRSILVALAMLTLSACDNTSARYSSDYAIKLSSQDLLILPVNTEANTVDATGTKTRKYEYEGHIEPLLANELKTQLEEKGYRARVLHKKDLMLDQSYVEYDAFKQAFSSAYEQAYKEGQIVKRDVAKNSLISLNGYGRALGAKLNAPLMVYIDYNESVRTADGQALDFAAGVAMQLLVGSSASSAPDKVASVVAIIDSNSDKVLWTNPGASAGGGPIAGMLNTDEEQSIQHIKNSLNWSLRELPKRDELFKQD